jgi:hypothetical protein
MQVWRSAGHRVEVDPGFRRTVRWYVGDELAAERRTADEKVRMEAGTDRMEVRFSSLGKPRRATLNGELDLVPDPGTPAAAHEENVRAHPTRYALIATVGGVAKVVVPIVVTLLLARFALPRLDLGLDVPAPDLPSVPLPDLALPEAVREVLSYATYVLPVLLAFALARAEINRRRRQDERRDDDQSRS